MTSNIANESTGNWETINLTEFPPHLIIAFQNEKVARLLY